MTALPDGAVSLNSYALFVVKISINNYSKRFTKKQTSPTLDYKCWAQS